MNTGPKRVLSPYSVPAELHSNSLPNPVYLHYSQPQLLRERSLNSVSDQWDCARIRSASWSKLCNIQKKGKFPKASGNLSQKVAELLRKERFRGLLYPWTFSHSERSSATFRFGLPNKPREKCHSEIRMRKRSKRVCWESSIPFTELEDHVPWKALRLPVASIP